MSVSAATVRKIITELNVEFLEREDAIQAVWLCLLSGQHGYLQGPSGTAKSALLNATARHIVGARYWHIQLDRMLDKSDSFGQYDIARFEAEQVWERDYADTFGDCHLALLDEVDKAGPATLVPYLEMLQDRRFKPGKAWVQAPLISAFGAANGSLAGEDGALRAIADRFLVRVRVDYLAETGNFIDLLQSAVQARPQASTTLTLAELQQLQEQVHAVTLPASVALAIADLRDQLRAEGVVCSDRRWKAAVTVLQAQAWLNDRCEVAGEDLRALRFVLWSGEDDLHLVTRLVLATASVFGTALLDCKQMLDEIALEAEQRKGEPAETRAALAGTMMIKLKGIGETIAGLAERQPEASDVLEVQNRLIEVRFIVYRHCLGLGAVQARRKAREKGAA